MNNTLRDRYFEQLKKNSDNALALMRLKNQDYAQASDPFQNFRHSAQFAGVTLEQGILVRLGDKFARFRNLTERGDFSGAVGEAVTDTLTDAINYVNILKTWIDLQKPEPDSAQLNLFEQYDEPEDGNYVPTAEDFKALEAMAGVAQAQEVGGDDEHPNWFLKWLNKK